MTVGPVATPHLMFSALHLGALIVRFNRWQRLSGLLNRVPLLTSVCARLLCILLQSLDRLCILLCVRSQSCLHKTHTRASQPPMLCVICSSGKTTARCPRRESLSTRWVMNVWFLVFCHFWRLASAEFGHLARMRNDRLLFLALHTVLPGRSRGRQRKQWRENFQRDVEQSGRSMSPAKDRTSSKAFIHPHRQTTWGKMDRSKEEEDLLSCVHMHRNAQTQPSFCLTKLVLVVVVVVVVVAATARMSVNTGWGRCVE